MPSITGLSQSHRVCREPRAQSSRLSRARPPVGTDFFYTLNEPALVTFTFTREATGWLVGGRCQAHRQRGHRVHRCVRAVRDAILYLGGRHAGDNDVFFVGQISRARWLPAGRYTLAVIAVDATGRKSKPQRLSFTVVT